MPEYRHPRTLEAVGGVPPAAIDPGDGSHIPVDDAGRFEADESVARALARYHGVDVADLEAGGETCDVVKSDGEVCGRELPCRYHSEDG